MIPGSSRLLMYRCLVQCRAVCSKNSFSTSKLAIGFGIGAVSISRLRRLRCDAEAHDPWLLVPEKKIVHEKSTAMNIINLPITLVSLTYTTLRKLLRCIGLFLRFSPLLITYPLTKIEALENVWWRILLWSVQNSGPTFIKLGQWASTRRDIFSKKFCDRLSVLHIQTKNKRFFRDKKKVLEEVFGKGFMKLHGKHVFLDIEPYSIGSGCIAQVYRGLIDVAEFEKATGKKIPELEGRETQKIAIKVADKDVDKQIELDLSILRSGAWIMQQIVPSLWYLDPTGALEQFEMVLRRQVDLSNEAKALKRFSDNFHSKETGIRFPIVLGYTKKAIVETYEEGIYINKLVAEEGQPELTARQSQAVRRRIALMGARALLKMIFVDNFVHGDLHPGNILIRFNDSENNLRGVHKAPKPDSLAKRGIDWFRSLVNWRSVPKIRFTDSPYLEDEPTLVLLDTGIAISETPKNLNNLKSLFRSVVEKRGYEVGRLLLTQSPFQQCKDPERFCRQVEKLVLKARSEKSLRTLNISALLSEMFTIVADHKVELDSAFTTVILSVMVLEGFGRSLDPDLDLFQCARPYLLNVFV
uniref:ABC1 domain-containing protein n=3 Tax=Caenorhabditis tropicalis TaxID=1561998 RepID=A0A1I7TMQ6_9PELO